MTRQQDPHSTLGDAVRTRRHELGLTQPAAAHKAGLTANGWGRIEAGHRVRDAVVDAVDTALQWPAGHAHALLTAEKRRAHIASVDDAPEERQ